MLSGTLATFLVPQLTGRGEYDLDQQVALSNVFRPALMNRVESRAQYSTSKGDLDSPRSFPGKHLCRNGSWWLDWLHRLEIRMTPSMDAIGLVAFALG